MKLEALKWKRTSKGLEEMAVKVSSSRFRSFEVIVTDTIIEEESKELKESLCSNLSNKKHTDEYVMYVYKEIRNLFDYWFYEIDNMDKNNRYIKSILE